MRCAKPLCNEPAFSGSNYCPLHWNWEKSRVRGKLKKATKFASKKKASRKKAKRK
jgi:hypothetical protein